MHQEPNPLVVQYDWSWMGILLLVLLVLGIVVLIRSWLRGNRQAGCLSVALVPLAGVFFLVFSYVSLRQTHQVRVASHRTSDTGQPEMRQPAESSLTQDLWDRLNQPQIALEAEEKLDVEPRPDWVDNPPKRVGNVYRRVVSSGPFRTVDECHNDLEAKLSEAVGSRIEQLVGPEKYRSANVPTLETMGISLDFVLRDICDQEFVETIEASFGEMKKVYVRMEFTPAVERELRQAWQDFERRHRLTTVAKYATFILMGLTFAYGLLKVDTWTRGYYTGRLLLGVPVVIIAIVVLLGFS